MMNGFGGMGFGWLIWIVIIGVVIWAVVQVTNRNKNIEHTTKESPLDLLKKRYANGEISKEEFDRIKKDLL